MTMPPPPPQQYPPSQPTVQRPEGTGAIAWGMGLFVFLCLPFFGSLLAGGLMVAVGLSQRSRGPIAAHNGTRAANWGLTYVIATVVLVGGHFLMLWYLSANNPDAIGGLFPFGILILLWGAITVWHLVVSVWGLVAAGANKPFWGNGIPVFTASR